MQLKFYLLTNVPGGGFRNDGPASDLEEVLNWIIDGDASERAASIQVINDAGDHDYHFMIGGFDPGAPHQVIDGDTEAGPTH